MLHNQKTKIIFVISLSSLLVILIVLKILIKPSQSDNPVYDNIKKIAYKDEELKKKIPAAVDSILYQFGIKKEWVKSSIEGTSPPVSLQKQDKLNKAPDKKSQKKDSPNLKVMFTKEISVPYDLSIAEVNIDINNYLGGLNCELSASEDAKSGNVRTEIYSNQDSLKKLIGILTYMPLKDLKRDAAEICIVLGKIEDLPAQDIDAVLSSSEKFSIVMPYDIEKSDIQAKVFDSRKDFLLNLNIGSEKDVEADFRADMKPGEWKSKIKNLSSEFNRASGVVLTCLRNIPGFDNEVREEFLKYTKNIYSDTIFIKFDTKDKPAQKISQLLNNIIQKNSKGYKKLFYLVNFSFEDLNEYSKQVYSLKKKGFRFRTFADIIKKQKE